MALFRESGKRLAIQLIAKGAPLKTIIDCGLTKPHHEYERRDFFINRLIFPLVDFRSRVVGFAGRSIDEQKPKYLNSPDTALYKKSSQLFGINEALATFRKTGEATLVEGYFDVIRMHACGFKNAVATCGTALTSQHVRLLKRCRVKKLCLLFDSDTAGLAANLKAIELCLPAGLPIKVATMPDGEDPMIF